MKRFSLSTCIILSIGLLAGCGDNLTFPTERESYQPGLLDPLTCVPNLDGQIDADEMEAAVGVPVSYLISPSGEERAVDIVGALDESDRRVWDWGADHASDQVVEIRAMDLSGKWYQDQFPAGQFVTPYDAAGLFDAVYRQDSEGFYLLGLASTQADPQEGRTLLVYRQPIVLYRFPLQVGDNWISVGEIQNGLYLGLPYAGRDTYEVSVDASGRLVLPDLTFTQALRVRTRTVLSPAVGSSHSQRIVSFLFECFGEVARATSRTDEGDLDFTTAVEVRRLGI